MCTFVTEKIEIEGHGKGAPEWIGLTTANVYYYHPVSLPLEHALIIDFLDQAAGASARVAVELSPDSARALVEAIETALARGEAEHADPEAAGRGAPLTVPLGR
jgi:hypothetical protein